MTQPKLPRPVPSALVRLLVPIPAVFVLTLAAGACSDDGEPTASSTTVPATTSPFEVVVTEDQIRLTLEASSGPTAEPADYTPDEQPCIVASIHETWDGRSCRRHLPDPDMEQSVAEIVIACVPIERYARVIADQLARQTLDGVDRACIEREVTSLQDTPDVLAAVFRGRPDAIPVVAGTASENCT